jgi:hypothetical protein
MRGKPPRWMRRPLYYYGFVLRYIFGYGTMDEVLGSLSNGMFRAETKEMREGGGKG